MPDRFRFLLPLAVVVLAANALGSTLFRDQWWGLNGLSFLPIKAASAWFILTVAGLSLLDRRSNLGTERATSKPGALTPILIAGVFAALAWIFRVRHWFLGDGLPLVQQLPKGTNFHHRQPLTYAIQQWWYRANGGTVSATPGPADEVAAGQIVAFGSVVAGALFAVVAWYLVREVLRVPRGVPRGPEGPRREEGRGAEIASKEPNRPTATTPAIDPVAALLATALLLTQGFDLLFFGYVENYTLVTALYGFYLLAGLAHLNGRWPLWPAAIAAILAGALHVSAAMLWPSLGVLIALAWFGNRRRDAIVGLVAGILTLVAMTLALGWLKPGYSWLANVSMVGRVAVTGGEGGMYKGYLGSAAHLRDFLNEQFLIGPMGLLLLLPAIVVAWRARTLVRPATIFLGSAALAWLAVTLTIGDTNLGYPRDWDVMAPGALFYLVTGLVLLDGGPTGPRPGRRFLAGALVISIFQFVPWVTVNADASRALERIKLLPMTGARTEVMVANWYFRNGDLPAAEEWYRKAIAAYDGSHVARSSLAYIYVQQKRFPEAIAMFDSAVERRPDNLSYWQSLVSTYIMAGDYTGAVERLAEVVTRFPNDAFSWLQYAQLLGSLNRLDEAQAAAQRVLALEPGNAEASKLLGQIDAAVTAPRSEGDGSPTPR